MSPPARPGTSARPAGPATRGPPAALLAAAALLLSAAAAPAQDAPLPSDSAREILNDVFIGQPAPGAFVVLSEGIVYRIEVEPAAASVSVRLARRPGMGPLFLVPLGGDAGAAGGAAYLMVPRLSGEYRLDVTTTGDEPVRVRIRVDPKENARWARMREETRDQRPAGISLRAVWFGPFRSMQRSEYDPARNASAGGMEACLAVLPHGAWLKNAFGGCVLSLTLLHRSRTDGSVVLIGTAPRVELWRSTGGATVALGLQVGLGQTTSGTGLAVDYFLAGGAGLVTFPLPATGHRLYGEVELGVDVVQGTVGSHDRISRDVPRLAAGLQLAL